MAAAWPADGTEVPRSGGRGDGRLFGVEQELDRAGDQPVGGQREPTAGQVGDAGARLTGAGESLQGADDAAVADDEDLLARVTAGGGRHRVDDPADEMFTGLAAGDLREPPFAPLVELTGPALLDLGTGQAAPLADVELSEAHIALDRCDAEPGRHDLRGADRAFY